jgi:hypothetical protein
VRGEFDEYFAPVLIAVSPFYRAMIDQTVNEFDCTVMTQTQPLCERANGRTHARRHAFQREKKLMLLRLNALGTRGFFAEMKELADAVPEFSKLAVTRN